VVAPGELMAGYVYRTAKQKAAYERRKRERLARAADRKKLTQLTAALRMARSHVVVERHAIRAQCRAALPGLRAKRAAIFAAHRAQARIEADAERARTRSACQQRMTEMRQQHKDKAASVLLRIAELHAHLRGQRDEEKQLRAARRELRDSQRSGKPKRAHRGHIEAIQESDSRVEHDLPENLIAVWRHVKNRLPPKYKSSDRQSRAEGFLHWVHDHPADAQKIAESAALRNLEDLEESIADYQYRTRSDTYYRGLADHELSAVPF
jgi:hypothetical protein